MNIPFDQYALYLQDDWRVNDRLTVNLGLRYDLVDGMPIDQSTNPNFAAMQDYGAAGRFANFPWLESFGQEPQNDRNNLQPRVGFAYDVQGTGRDIIRGGWGVYQDFGYTNSNGLFAAIDAAGGHGPVFTVTDPSGIRRADGTLLPRRRSTERIANQNEVEPGALAALRPGHLAAARAALHPADQPRLGAPDDTTRRRSPSTSSALRGATSTSASVRTTGSTAGRGG